jgi:hypothetical protein
MPISAMRELRGFDVSLFNTISCPTDCSSINLRL